MRKASSSNSSSSINSNNNNNPFISTASSLSHRNGEDLPTDLRLGLGISTTQHVGTSMSRGHWQQMQPLLSSSSQAAEVNDGSFFVKVYMEGIPIGRKLNLLAHDGYLELVKTLEQMFDTTILWGNEMDGVQPERCHVLTYEDGEGDLIMVGDVPWEMFLSTVKRLKITRVDAFDQRGDSILVICSLITIISLFWILAREEIIRMSKIKKGEQGQGNEELYKGIFPLVAY